MKDCRPMYEYAWLVGQIRANSERMNVEAAAEKAIDDMPGDFGIRDFLVAHREEIKMNILTEYNEEETLRLIAEEERALGATWTK